MKTMENGAVEMDCAIPGIDHMHWRTMPAAQLPIHPDSDSWGKLPNPSQKHSGTDCAWLNSLTQVRLHACICIYWQTLPIERKPTVSAPRSSVLGLMFGIKSDARPAIPGIRAVLRGTGVLRMINPQPTKEGHSGSDVTATAMVFCAGLLEQPCSLPLWKCR